jgi:hypothetical protein
MEKISVCTSGEKAMGAPPKRVSYRGSSSKPHEDARDMKSSQKVSRRLFVTARKCAEPLEVVKETFDLTPKPVQSAALATPVVLSVRLHCDDRLHASRADGINDSASVIPSICDERPASCVLDEMLRLHRVVLLARR